MAEPRPPGFSKFPLLFLAACFAGGIVAAGSFPISLGALLAIAASSAAAAAITIRGRFAVAFVAIAFFAAGSAVYLLHESLPNDRIKRIYDEGQIASGDPVVLTGTLAGNREASVDGFYITLNAESISYKNVERPVSGRVKLFAPVRERSIAAEYDEMDLTDGARIRVACSLMREERYQNPGVASAKEMLDRQGIDASATLRSPLMIEELADPGEMRLITIYDAREGLINAFREGFDAPTAGVMIASLLGNKNFLDKNSADVFREGGTFHILVISGLHITFIGGLLLVFIRLFTRRRLVHFVFVASLLWAYTLAVGADVPVVRASLMFTILLFSHVIYRTSSLANSLGACALLLLVWRPQDIFGPSFQLTFVSVAAIVIAGFPIVEKLRAIGSWTPSIERPFPAQVPKWVRRFCETVYWREDAWKIEARRNIWSARLFKEPYFRMFGIQAFRRAAAFVLEGLLISAIVQIFLLPFVIVYFHRVSVFSVLLNLWAGALIALESFTALLAVLFSLISNALALPFAKLAEAFNVLLIGAPRFFVENDLASFRLPAYSGPATSIYAVYLLAVAVLGCAAFRWDPFALVSSKQRRWFNSGTICGVSGLIVLLGSVIILHPNSAPAPDGRLHVDMLDVGQGDSALITFPNGQTMLVDGGGRVSYHGGDDEGETFEPDVAGIGESVVSPFLWEKGYSRIDFIVATHADADHIQGLTDVARNFAVGKALFGRTPPDDPEFAALANVLGRRSIRSETIAKGQHLEIDGVSVDVLWPAAADDAAAPSDNNHSVVLRLVMGKRTFVLTGDIERDAERELVIDRGTLRADVVKVPHHGSRTSSTKDFVDAAGADYAVISVGKRSPFGHPHEEVVKRWADAGAKVLLTGQRGTVSFSTNGTDLVLSTYVN